MRAMGQSDDDNDGGAPIMLPVPIRRPRRTYAKFNKAAQDEFCLLIGRGHSRADACRVLKLDRSVVDRWIADGRVTAEEWLERGRTREWVDRVARPRRKFFLSLQQAQARARGFVRETLVTHASGYHTVKEVVDQKTGERREVLVYVPGDWRAADALGKRMERMDLHPLKKALQKAELEIVSSKVEEQRANTRRAIALAELAERGVHPVNGLLVFAQEFLEAAQPEVRGLIEQEMARLGYKHAPPDAVQQAAEALTEDEIRDREEFSARWEKLRRQQQERERDRGDEESGGDGDG